MCVLTIQQCSYLCHECYSLDVSACKLHCLAACLAEFVGGVSICVSDTALRAKTYTCITLAGNIRSLYSANYNMGTPTTGRALVGYVLTSS